MESKVQLVHTNDNYHWPAAVRKEGKEGAISLGLY